MNTRNNWIIYSALRVLFFAVPFALFMWIGWVVWVAAIVAALISLALSMIFLSKRRDAASTSIYEWRQRTRTEDDILEDEVIDAGLAKDANTGTDASLPNAATTTHVAGTALTANADQAVTPEADPQPEKPSSAPS